MSVEDENIDFEPTALLAELKIKALEPTPKVLPDRLPLASIKLLPELFQPRDTRLDPRQVQKLERGIERDGELDAVEVIQIGAETYLIDGHHRMEAYANAKFTSPVQVVYFSGTVEEAVLHAGKVNSGDKLPMDMQARTDFAWRLTLMGTYSKAQRVKAAGVSDGTVSQMQRVRKTLGSDAYEYKSWAKARDVAIGKAGADISDEDREQWKREQADRWADRMAQAFSNKLSKNLEVAAMALDAHFGRHLPALVRELMAFVPDDEGDEFEGDF